MAWRAEGVKAYVEAVWEDMELGVVYYDSAEVEVPVSVEVDGSVVVETLRVRYPEVRGWRVEYMGVDSIDVYVDTGVAVLYPVRVRSCLVLGVGGGAGLDVWGLDAEYSGGRVEVRWEGDAECYDVEWVYVPVREEDGDLIPPGKLRYSFREKGVRVRVCGRRFVVPAVYRDGYLLFRVRGVEGAHVGRWTLETEYDYGCRCEEPALVSLMQSGYGGLVYVPGVDEPTYIKSLVASEGEWYWRGEWYDGFGRVRQEAMQLYGTEVGEYKLVREFGYDHAGRLSLRTYPGVVVDSALRYVEGFATAGGQRFVWRVWEVAGNQGVSVPVDSTSALGRTYSSQFEFAERYPYVAWGRRPYEQVVYRSDGRVGRRGWGDARSLGSGHEEEYRYGVVLNELDRLMGTDAREPWLYRKVFERDANGQWRVRYEDVEGRVVAEGYVGEPPLEVEPVVADSVIPAGYPIYKTADMALRADGVAGFSIVLPGTEVRMRYRVGSRMWELECPVGDSVLRVEYRCCYRVVLEVGGEWVPGELFSLDTVLSYGVWEDSFSFELDTGQYYVYRSLEWANEPSESFVDTLVEFLVACIGGGAGGGDACVEESAVLSLARSVLCRQEELQMVADVMPGGQYMRFEQVGVDSVVYPGGYNLLVGVPVVVLDSAVREAYWHVQEAGVSNPWRSSGVFSFRTPLYYDGQVWHPWYFDEEGRIDTLWVGGGGGQLRSFAWLPVFAR